MTPPEFMKASSILKKKKLEKTLLPNFKTPHWLLGRNTYYLFISAFAGNCASHSVHLTLPTTL